MNADELRSAFAELAAPVLPVEDPYGRLLRRARRSRRAHLAAWFSTLFAGLTAALLVPLLAPASGGPQPAPSPSVREADEWAVTPWVRWLLETPARGSLASDRAFTTGIADRLSPEMFGLPPDMSRRIVLFAGDFATYRVVLVALYSDTRQAGVWFIGDAGTGAAEFLRVANAQAGTLELPNPPGGPGGDAEVPGAGSGAGPAVSVTANPDVAVTANPESLVPATPAATGTVGPNSPGAPGTADPVPPAVNPAGPRVLVVPLHPFTVTAVADPQADRYLAVGLAPAGCQVAISQAGARDSAGTTWSNVKSGDFVMLPLQTYLLQRTYVQVSCGGVLRYRQPLLSGGRLDLASEPVTGAQAAAALAGARGTPPQRDLVRNALSQMITESGARVGDCHVLYNGAVPGAVDASPVPGGTVREPPVLVVACTTPHGNTQFSVTGVPGGGFGGYTTVKLTDPRAIIAVRDVVEQETATALPGGATAHSGGSSAGERVLVLAPRTAVALEVTATGQPPRSVRLVDGVGSILVPQGQTVRLRALDATGAVVGSGIAPIAGENIPAEVPPPPVPFIDNWS